MARSVYGAIGPVHDRRPLVGAHAGAGGPRRLRGLVPHHGGPDAPAGQPAADPDAQGSAVRHGVHLRDLPARTRPKPGHPYRQRPAQPARCQREGLHRTFPPVLPADADHSAQLGHRSLSRRARRRHPQAPRRHGRSIDLPRERRRSQFQRDRRKPDGPWRTLLHGTALHPGDRGRRQAHPARRRRAHPLRACPHSAARGDQGQPGRWRHRRRPALERARPLDRRPGRTRAAPTRHRLRRD